MRDKTIGSIDSVFKMIKKIIESISFRVVAVIKDGEKENKKLLRTEI